MSRRRPVQLCTPPSSSGTHCHTASSHTLHTRRHGCQVLPCQVSSLRFRVRPKPLAFGSLQPWPQCSETVPFLEAACPWRTPYLSSQEWGRRGGLQTAAGRPGHQLAQTELCSTMTPILMGGSTIAARGDCTGSGKPALTRARRSGAPHGSQQRPQRAPERLQVTFNDTSKRQRRCQKTLPKALAHQTAASSAQDAFTSACRPRSAEQPGTSAAATTHVA